MVKMLVTGKSLLSAVIVMVLFCMTALADNCLLECSFQSDNSLNGWQHGAEATVVACPKGGMAVEIDVPKDTTKKGTIGIYKALDVKRIAGKKVTLSVDVSGEKISQPRNKWGGGTALLSIHSPTGNHWPKVRSKTGTFNWERLSFDAVIPGNATKVYLHLGMQTSYGKIFFRNLKVTVSDTILDLKQAANMGYADKVAGDGKGGWSDQGPDNDASKFKFKQKQFANVPFQTIDPKKNNGKSILVFKSAKFPNGIKQADISFGDKPVKGKFLYLLHTLTWGKTKGKPVGSVKLNGENGGQQTIQVIDKQDVADWWGPKNLANGYVGASWQNSEGGFVGMYVSRFAIDETLDKITSVTFESANSMPIWIVAAATISDHKYEFPEAKKVVIKEGREWRKVVKTKNHGVIAGSPLDLATWLPTQEAGAFGRVIVNKAGRLAFAKNPDKAIRFFASSEGSNAFFGRGKIIGPQLTTKKNIEEYVRQLHMHGFNMIRMHFLDVVLLRKATRDLEFNKDSLDRFDYLVYCLKKRGMYLNWDAMTSILGYSAGSPWNKKKLAGRYYKFSVHFDEKVKQNWLGGVRQLMTHVNPYTKTKLAEDPVLAMVMGFNEQEAAFIVPGNWAIMKPFWAEFLKQKYGTIAKLRTAWKTLPDTVKTFADIPVFTIEQSSRMDQRGKDIAEFITQREIKTYKWFEEKLREMGYNGLFTNYNFGKSMRYNLVRKDMDLVTMNTYHAHPSFGTRSGSVIDQSSSIGRAGNTNRLLTATKIANKPLVITEQAHVFWNKYRYEQAFVTGAYAAFQNYDGLTYFSQPICIVPVNGIYTFAGRLDPVIQVQNFLNFFMYIRRDITPADSAVKVNIETDDFYNKIDHNGAMNSRQSRLALITDLSVDFSGKESKLKLGERELAINSTGGARVLNNLGRNLGGFNSVADSDDSSFNLDKLVQQMKSQGLMPKTNRTDALNEKFETDTGEMFMDCRKNFMSIDTPRLQGICAEAGVTQKLSSFAIEKMTQRGNLAVVSIDGEKSITDAKRLMVTYATDALNSNMEFDDKTRRTIRKRGQSPVLLRTGEFTVSMTNKHAADMVVYVLEVDGSRRMKLKPEVKGDTLRFNVNTATLKGGPALFFEVTASDQ